MHYLLKQCGFQELGSLGMDGKAKRGRYLMISQNKNILDFFPPLSIEIPNDTAMLPIVPLYSNIRTYCSYVYHNSKFNGPNAPKGRNEYRIYLNNELEDHELYFSSEDIVVLRKGTGKLIDGNKEIDNYYYLDVLKDHSSELFLKLCREINDYPIRGAYAVYDGVINEFEEKVISFEEGLNSQPVLIDNSVTDRIQKSTETNQRNIFNSSTFRDFVLAGYGNACALSGRKAGGAAETSLDVVYIRPKADGGTCMPNNGIALSSIFSTAFITGRFTLSRDYEVIVHPDNDIYQLQEYSHRQIRLPANSFFRPEQSNVQYHREHIFGSFEN